MTDNPKGGVYRVYLSGTDAERASMAELREHLTELDDLDQMILTGFKQVFLACLASDSDLMSRLGGDLLVGPLVSVLIEWATLTSGGGVMSFQLPDDLSGLKEEDE